MRDRSLLLLRCVAALVWLYNGLWQKILLPDPTHLAIVLPTANQLGLAPLMFLGLIGLVETVLALWILSGWRCRLANAAQMALLLALNLAGILFGDGGVENPVALLVNNLPLFAIGMVLIMEGPGRFALGVPHGKRG